ncbi:MAG: S8 family serine peptidase [Leptonema sp. (in: bacteria)]
MNCTIFKHEDSKNKEMALLLYYILNLPEPLEVSCEEIPENQASVGINTYSENCSMITDPLYSQQWHFTTINLNTTWQSYCGSNVKIGIIDDGLEIYHEDLTANVEGGKSYNYKTGTTDPSGNPVDGDSIHGTAVAGLIAAKDNSLGIRGVSPKSSIRGYNAIATGSLSNIVDATVKDIENVWISNNSWGPSDGTGLLVSSDSLWQSAILQGLRQGRFGLGTLYIFAAGNGAQVNSYLADNSNYDEYANFYGITAVCAVGLDEKQASYSEKGANLWICAPSMGNNNSGLVTTDLTGAYGYNSNYFLNDLPNNKYTKFFSGTSGSTPIVSGALALLLQSKPYLSWRDVRLILARSAKKNDPTDSDWTTNAMGYSINHKYGFGLLDVQKAIQIANSWTNLGSYKKCTVKNIHVHQDIIDNGPPTISEFDASILGINKIEWVEVTIHINHQYFGDLQINLYSPSGTEAILAEPHNCFYNNQQIGCNMGDIVFRFGIARFLEENANGKFRIEIQDKHAKDNGYFKKWDLTLFGR